MTSTENITAIKLRFWEENRAFLNKGSLKLPETIAFIDDLTLVYLSETKEDIYLTSEQVEEVKLIESINNPGAVRVVSGEKENENWLTWVVIACFVLSILSAAISVCTLI